LGDKVAEKTCEGAKDFVCTMHEAGGKMHELIYADDSKDYEEIKATLFKEYPDAEINDASDYIHPNRFEFICSVANGTFYRFAIREGFALGCLGVGLLEYRKPKLLLKWLEQVRELQIQTEAEVS
jgi:hypothetical protein